nr:hypothetical protein [Streptomyces sp. HNM0574]
MPAQRDDGNAWVRGLCMLYCRNRCADVLWLGPVRTPGAAGQVYACGACLAELDHMVRLQNEALDAVPRRHGTAPGADVNLSLPPHRPRTAHEPRAVDKTAYPASGGRHRRRRASVASLLPWLRHG